MGMQQILAEKTSDFERPGEASRRLWLLLTSADENATPTDRPGTPRKNSLESVALSVPGRYTTPNGVKFFCRVTEITALGMTIQGGAGGYPGEWIVVNLRGLGTVEGVISRKEDEDFILDLREPPDKVERLSRRVMWQIRRQSGAVPERRASERIQQHERKTCLKTADGREMFGDMLDLSMSGAAVHLGLAALYLWVGQPVALDNRPGQVLRQFPGGVVVKFDDEMDVDTQGEA